MNLLKAFTSKNMKIFSISSFSSLRYFSNARTIELVKILRQETNSPMNHIKKALEETNNNLEEAKTWLKKKGFKDAEKRMSRNANVSMIGIRPTQDHRGYSISNVSCETDFVYGTDYFKHFSSLLLDTLNKRNKSLEVAEIETEKIYFNESENSQTSNVENFKGLSLSEGLKLIISKTQENCKINSASYYQLKENEVFGYYLHNSPLKDLGSKGAYLIFSVENLKELNEDSLKKLREFANNIAMHIVAAEPKFFRKEDVTAELIENYKKIFEDQVKSMGGKNTDTEKIMNSKYEKWYSEIVLLEQEYLIVDYSEKAKSTKIKDIVSNFGNELKIKKLEIKEYKLIV